ncbi:MAG: hypothetical protein WDO13_12795 [Verrucomicrobiota bacterium]
MSTLETIVEELKSLPTPALQEAAAFIHQLREASRADRQAILRATSGGWTSGDADAIEKVIKENCETIDAREW